MRHQTKSLWGATGSEVREMDGRDVSARRWYISGREWPGTPRLSGHSDSRAIISVTTPLAGCGRAEAADVALHWDSADWSIAEGIRYRQPALPGDPLPLR